MSDTSGRSWQPPLAHYVPDESSSRTWQVMSLWGWTPFSGTLPRWGMTRRGELYELPTPALPTVGPASSSLLPTPAVNDMGAGKTVEAWDEWTAKMRAKHGNGNGHGPSLAIEAQRLLPTPVADYSRGLPQPGTDFQSLPNVVTSLLPTPSAADAMGGHLSRSGDRSDELLLPGVAKALTLMPTPTVGDAASARNSTATRHRLPPTGIHAGNTLTDLLVPLPGESTSLLSVDGRPSPGAEPHDLLSPDSEAESA